MFQLMTQFYQFEHVQVVTRCTVNCAQCAHISGKWKIKISYIHFEFLKNEFVMLEMGFVFEYNKTFHRDSHAHCTICNA